MWRQLGITVSAMALSAQLGIPVGAAEPTTEQLREIASLLGENDAAGLRGYLRANPELLVEDTPLAGLLRDFMTEPTANASPFSIDPGLRGLVGRLGSQNSNSTDGPRTSPGGISLY